MTTPNAPWLNFYGDVPAHLDYPDGSMFQEVLRQAKETPHLIALTFEGKHLTYRVFAGEVARCAKALRRQGIGPGDRVTICLPNLPQAVIAFYAVNVIGAISSMVHPLSSEGELAFFLQCAPSKAVIALGALYPKFDAIRDRVSVPLFIAVDIADALSPLKRIGYQFLNRGKTDPLPKRSDVLPWRSFLQMGESYRGSFPHAVKADDPAVILYSGGTTGKNKGILLSNRNFNALALEAGAMSHCLVPGHTMLAVMPVFHGFGLGIGIHTMLIAGCRCLLIPRFSAETFPALIKKERPNYIAGVPTLFQALMLSSEMESVDLSCLEGIFSGGDSLPPDLKKQFDAFLQAHGSRTQIREGYGMTESVTASCLTPYQTAREGSVGLPFPDIYYKIVTPGTVEGLPTGELGEICISGPTVMLGYLGEPEETQNTLRVHADGRVWLHTGDLGSLDADGFVYFRQRIKRMIISSGYSIYPSQLEHAIDEHEAVQLSCVIGLPDPYKMQRVKAFVQLKEGYTPSDQMREMLMAHCRKHISRYALPSEIEFRDSLPMTRIGKVAFNVLEQEELAKLSASER